METRKSQVALLSVASNSALVVFKLLVGLAIGSVSVISEAIHSGVDLIASVIALFAVRSSAKPPDSDHAYGHEKWENLSGAIEALLIFAAALWIINEAVHKLLNPQALESVSWGILVMGVSAVLNTFVARQLFQVGHATESQALLADAWHLRTDVWTSAGVCAGLGMIWLGHRFLPTLNLSWIDPLAAILVALLILRAAWTLTLAAGRDLLDASLPPAEQAWITEYLASQRPEICGFHRLRTRRAGHRRFVELHLELPPELSVAASHAIADRIEAAISAQYPSTDVTVHVEPSAD